MTATSTSQRIKSLTAPEPNIWQRYSPRGECPLSVAGSVVLHVAFLAAVVALSAWVLLSDYNASKPPEMTFVEVPGYGGGLGGDVKGPGKESVGEPGRQKEGAQDPKVRGTQVKPSASKDSFEFKSVIPKIGVEPQANGADFDHADGKDLWGEFERRAKLAENDLTDKVANKAQNASGAQRPGSKAGEANGKGGPAGGPKDPGIGNNKKDPRGTGTSRDGMLPTQQQLHQGRWAFEFDATGTREPGETEVPKWQALKATLYFLIPSKPGFSYRFDFSKPAAPREDVPLLDEPDKIRWYISQDQMTMMRLKTMAKALNLPEVPLGLIVYLPRDLEETMARLERNQGHQDHEISKTIWDVRLRDGAYENEPYVKRQLLRQGN